MPPKRKIADIRAAAKRQSSRRPAATSGPSPSKRTRKIPLGDDGKITASTNWASVVAASNIDTSLASTRKARFKAFPTLSSCCVRVLAANFKAMARSDPQATRLIKALRILPDPILDKVWRRLLIECPSVFTVHMIDELIGQLKTVFLPGESLPVIFNLDGLGSLRVNHRATRLELTSNSNLSDKQVATFLSTLPDLEEVILRDVSQIKSETVKVLCALGPQLRVVNLSGTSINVADVRDLILSCRNIEVLKLALLKYALIPNHMNKDAWKDLAQTILEVRDMSDDEREEERQKGLPLAKLRVLKLKQAVSLCQRRDPFLKLNNVLQPMNKIDISNAKGVHAEAVRYLAQNHLQNLEHLDLTGFTGHPTYLANLGSSMALRKLHVPDMIINRDLYESALQSHADSLQVLSCKVLNTPAIELAPDRNLYDAFREWPQLKRLSLELPPSTLGIVKMGALYGILRLVRDSDLRELSLANSVLHFSDPQAVKQELLAELGEATEAPALEKLNLANVQLDDELIKMFTVCSNLQSLDLSGTKVTGESLRAGSHLTPSDPAAEPTAHAFLTACPYLDTLDLTSCRGIPVAARRNFFQASHAAL